MKKITVMIICALFGGMIASAQKNFLDVNYVEVSATAEMEVTPDKIYLKIVIDEKDSKGKISIDKQEQDMIAVLKTINGINVPEDLTMKDLESQFKYKRTSNNQILLSKEYELIVKNGKTASEVVSKLEKTGISNVSLVKVDHSKMEEFKKTVRENATKTAKEKASSLAQSIGQTIGKAIYISEHPNFPPYHATGYVNKAVMSDFVEGYTSEVELSKIKIESTVEVKFELK